MKLLLCVRRIRSDALLRRKLCITAAVLFSYVLQGWSEQQIGMSLPSLQRQIDVDLSTMSFTMVAWLAGCVIGSLVSGVMFDTFNRLLLMGVVTLGLAVSTVALPFSPSLVLMLVCRFVFGVFNSSSDTGCNTIIPTLWGDACGPFVQMMYVSYAFGGIISPFITIPFMTRDDVKVLTSPSPSNLNDTTPYVTDVSSTIHIAFIITGVLFFLCAIPYFIMKFKGNFDVLTGTDSATSENTEDGHRQTRNDYTLRKTVIILSLIAGVHASYIATEDSLVAYLHSFTLEYLQWSNLKSGTLISLYWISNCVFGLLSILLVTLIDPANILWLSLIITNCGFGLVMTGQSSGQHWLIWTGFIISGCTTIMVQTAVFTWSNKYLCEITGKVSSFFIVSAGLWSSANTVFVSFMMDKYSKLYFVIIIFGGTILCLLLYASAYFIRFKCSGPSTRCCRMYGYSSKSLVVLERSKRVTSVSVIMSTDK